MNKASFIHTISIYLHLYKSDDYIINLPQSKGLIQICQSGGKGGKYLETGLIPVEVFSDLKKCGYSHKSRGARPCLKGTFPFKICVRQELH